MDGPDRLVHPLQPVGPRVRVADPVDLRGKVDDGFGRERLARPGLTAQPGGEIERGAAIAALDRDRLARVEPDANTAIQLGLEPDLELERRPQGASSQDEDGQGLVTAQLEQEPVVGRDDLADDRREPSGQVGRGIRAALGGVGRVAADIRDEERPELRLRGRLRVGDGGEGRVAPWFDARLGRRIRGTFRCGRVGRRLVLGARRDVARFAQRHPPSQRGWRECTDPDKRSRVGGPSGGASASRRC